jgi:hypothetical protein
VTDLAPRVGVGVIALRDGLVLLGQRIGSHGVREPAKCSAWGWFRWSEVPRPLFSPLASLYASGYVPENAS